ncbi:MAG: replication-associated recombination protein A [Campylobacterota bacterium]|nr:replication-associated recombination protein A [Campylobacterota bacterium]
MNLALKYRPKSLDEMVGQEHLLGDEAPLRILIESEALPHTFLYGPPGSGKTTLARIIATVLELPFYEMNATTLKVEELRKIFKEYANALQKPLIFIDEVHRLSKNQQEVLLPFMENNAALIIGASTENPYYSLAAAMRSRSHLFELDHINDEAMESYLDRILAKESIITDSESKSFLITSSSGDARAMLNLLESGSKIENPLRLETLKKIRPYAMQAGSSEDDSHYELTSAMIKSIRGSDVDAGLYYLARLINGGEPAEFIARRLAILASEDIGNANPNALNLASSTLNIVKHIGYPEARISLSQLVIYLASSPKSNSAYTAINKAQKSISEGMIYPVPAHIKTHARNYLYPHDFGGWVKQSYLERPLCFYENSAIGFEKNLAEWREKIISGKK